MFPWILITNRKSKVHDCWFFCAHPLFLPHFSLDLASSLPLSHHLPRTGRTSLLPFLRKNSKKRLFDSPKPLLLLLLLLLLLPSASPLDASVRVCFDRAHCFRLLRPLQSTIVTSHPVVMLLVNCSNCHTPLQLPPGAPSIRCAICRAVTLIADPRSPASHSSSSSSSSHHHHLHHYPPPPLHHAPPGPPAPAYGAKRALICGVSYRNSRDELKGCVNDAKCMKFLLTNRFKFPESSILVLTGASTFYASVSPPTKNLIFLVFDRSLLSAMLLKSGVDCLLPLVSSLSSICFFSIAPAC